MSWGSAVREADFTRSVLGGRPFDVLVQVTNRCNMTCPFCDFWPNGAPPQEELTVAEMARLSDQIAEAGTCLVSIEGGEPFVRPDLVEIVRVFARRHLAVLYTNGWYVTEESARALFAAGLTQVGVSIDYPDRRHDAKRGLPGASEKAWQAVELFRDAAPHGGRQVHVMTVLTRDNAAGIEALLQRTRDLDVGYVLTLLSTHGFRRGRGGDALPEPGIGEKLAELWDRYPHWRFFREYLERMDDFLGGAALPVCGAGRRAFNVDHLGNVAPCIEKIDTPVGNLRETPLGELRARLAARRDEVESCQACWTACRGFVQIGSRPGVRGVWQMATRMRSA